MANIVAEFVTIVFCSSPIIGGWSPAPDNPCVQNNTEVARGYAQWEVPERCAVAFASQKTDLGTSTAITIECKGGERFLLPASMCSVQTLRRPK